jgi:hypothetical protein
MTVCAFNFRTEDRSSQKRADGPSNDGLYPLFSLEAAKYCHLDSVHAGIFAIAFGGGQ